MQSRRSNTNLSYLTLAPLTSRLPLDDEGGDEIQVPTPWTQRTSYISGKSAPTTPGILSRTSSHARLGPTTSNKLAASKSYTNLAFADAASLPRSKSTTLLIPVKEKKKRKTKPVSRLHDATDSEWLYRAGAVITSETRESKGQSWLVSRESSTSLVVQDQSVAHARAESAYSFQSTRPSRNPSRNPSRTASARTSRRGSKVGSRAELTYLATPGGSRTSLNREAIEDDDYFGHLHDSSGMAGPDFVDAEEDEDDEDYDDADNEEDVRLQEDEVAKLASNRGFGLGSIVDRLIAWTLFEVKEDGHETDDEEMQTVEQDQQQMPKRDQPRSTQHSHIKAQQPSRSTQNTAAENQEARGGWADAAWLLSVASKVVL